MLNEIFEVSKVFNSFVQIVIVCRMVCRTEQDV